MTDETKRVILNRTVIDDTEAQMAGDVETPWVELPEQAAAPASPTDKSSCLLYVLAADHRLRAKLSTGAVLDLTLAGTAPLTFKGAIGVAANFPTAALVESGWTYRITADVIDNDGTKTNTGLAFVSGSTIAWTGATWCDIGEETTTGFIAVTPSTLTSGDQVAMVDTVTIAAPAVVNLPVASAVRVGEVKTVLDATGAATALAPVAITPNGTDTIDGVNAAVNVTRAFGGYAFQCVQTGAATYGWSTLSGGELRAATARLAAIGAGRSHEDSRQLAAASETLRVFRPLEAGRIIRVTAETGTVAAAGESMTFDVQIAGVTALTGVITIDNTVVIDTPVPGVLGAGAIAQFAGGELITVVRTYVPGGGATPMRDTVVDIEVQID